MHKRRDTWQSKEIQYLLDSENLNSNGYSDAKKMILELLDLFPLIILSFKEK